MQNCVVFINAFVNLLGLHFITSKYHQKVLDLTKLLQCIAAQLLRHFPAFLESRNTLVQLVLIFIPCGSTQMKPIVYRPVLKTLLRGWQLHQIVRKSKEYCRCELFRHVETIGS